MIKILTIFIMAIIIGVMSCVGGNAIPPHCYSTNNSVLTNSEMNTKEIWKDIVGYEGSYQISDLGRIKSLKRIIRYKSGYSLLKNELIMKLSHDKKGYIITRLSKSGVGCTIKVHRLVAIAFVPNIENKPQVNHKNGIKDDNRVENIEWATNSENQIHAIRTGLKIPAMLGRTGINSPFSKPVVQLTIDGCIVNQFYSLKDAFDKTKISKDGISRVCCGRQITAGKYKWKFKQ